MLKSIRNNSGVVGLTLSSIGLIIATGVILAAVFSFLYFSEFQRSSELKNIGSGFSIMVEGMDTRFFENTSMYFFLDKEYYYNVSISSEYIIVNAEGSWWGRDLSEKQRFVVKPWPRKNNPDWVSGEQLHVYLRDNYGRTGKILEPINETDIDDVKNYINSERESANLSLVSSPFYVDRHKPVFIDKVLIYYNTDDNNGWDKELDEKQELLIIYQNP